MNRRALIQLSGAVAGAGLLEACAPSIPRGPAAPTAGSGTASNGSVLPTYMAATNGPKPDYPAGGDMYCDGFTRYPSNPAPSMSSTPPGTGSTVTIFTEAALPLPTAYEQNPAWQAVNKALNANVQYNIAAVPDYPGPFVRADPATGLPFADDEFDIVYCNSVIEHVPRARRAAFAAELRRVGRGWLVQTPAWSFPLEPHALLPFAHWLPPAARRRYWRLGAAGSWEQIELLRRRELEALFGPAHAERFAGLVKSWVCVRAPVA